MGGVWRLMKETASGFIADDALSHGAAMAFYAATSMAPVLLIVIAIAGLVFGHDAAQNAVAVQLTGLLRQQSAEMLQTAINSASNKNLRVSWRRLSEL